MITAVAVGFYIFAGVVFFLGTFLEESFFWSGSMIDYTLLGLIIAGAICILPTCMLVYSANMYPDYSKKKNQDSIVENYKETVHEQNKSKAIKSSISVIIWTLTLVVYFLISFITMAWYVTWVIFLIGACVQAIAECDFTVEKNFTASSTSGDLFLRNISARKINASSVSGRISIDHAMGEVLVSTTSGDIMMEQADGKLDASSTSGDIIIASGKGDRSVSTVSGYIKIEDMEGKFDVGTTSGSIRIEGSSASGMVDTISGDIVISLQELTGNLDANTVSGEVSLPLPGDKGFSLEFDSVSGDCNTFFDDQLSFNKRRTNANGDYEGGGNRITVSTTSGSLRISKY